MATDDALQERLLRQREGDEAEHVKLSIREELGVLAKLALPSMITTGSLQLMVSSSGGEWGDCAACRRRRGLSMGPAGGGHGAACPVPAMPPHAARITLGIGGAPGLPASSRGMAAARWMGGGAAGVELRDE